MSSFITRCALGAMVMVTGVFDAHNYATGMFHLTTHAFFKALLFLGAGSLIIALHHEQNIWKMGGLSGKMRLTFLTFLVGALALMGIPGFSGFFSKEGLLTVLYLHNKLLFGIGGATAFLTAFYMTRLLVVVFIGLPRSEAAMHARESNGWMTVPLVILAVFSWIGGYEFMGIQSLLPNMPLPEHGHTVMICSLVALAVGSSAALFIYWNRVS